MGGVKSNFSIVILNSITMKTTKFRTVSMTVFITAAFALLVSCSKDVIPDDSDIFLELSQGQGSGEYGPMICSTPPPEPGGDTGCGAKCGLTSWGGCYEETPCYGERTMDDGPATLDSGSFADVYAYLLSVGEISVMEEGDIIQDERLLAAMKRDGHPIIE